MNALLAVLVSLFLLGHPAHRVREAAHGLLAALAGQEEIWPLTFSRDPEVRWRAQWLMDSTVR